VSGRGQRVGRPARRGLDSGVRTRAASPAGQVRHEDEDRHHLAERRTPAVRFHAHEVLGLDFLASDERWVWYLVEDWSGPDYVYRVPLSGVGPVTAYRMRQPGDGGAERDVLVDHGKVYELLITTNAAAAQVLLVQSVG